MRLWWIALLLVACIPKPIKQARVEKAIETLWVDKDLDAIDRYYHPEAAVEARQFMTESLSAWPDPKIVIDDLVIEGPVVVVEWTVTGKHRDIDRDVTLSGVFVDRIKGTKVVSETRYFDNLDVYEQLGFEVVPPDGDEAAPPPPVID